MGAFEGHNMFSGIFAGAFPQGSMGRERPSQGVLRKCDLRNTAVPDPGTEKGGSLPSTSDFPVRAPAFGDLVVTTSRKGRSGNSPV